MGVVLCLVVKGRPREFAEALSVQRAPAEDMRGSGGVHPALNRADKYQPNSLSYCQCQDAHRTRSAEKRRKAMNVDE